MFGLARQAEVRHAEVRYGLATAYRVFDEGSVRCLVGIGSVVHGAPWLGWVRLGLVRCGTVWMGMGLLRQRIAGSMSLLCDA